MIVSNQPFAHDIISQPNDSFVNHTGPTIWAGKPRSCSGCQSLPPIRLWKIPKSSKDVDGFFGFQSDIETFHPRLFIFSGAITISIPSAITKLIPAYKWPARSAFMCPHQSGIVTITPRSVFCNTIFEIWGHSGTIPELIMRATKKGRSRKNDPYLAGGKGFEPLERSSRSLRFQRSTLNHSVTLPFMYLTFFFSVSRDRFRSS